MDEWINIKLGKLAKVISGYAFKKNDFIDFGIPIIKIKNIGKEEIKKEELSYVKEDFIAKLNEKYHIKNGDILISLTGSHLTQPNSVVGRIAKFTESKTYLLNQRAGKIIPFDYNVIYPNFLYYSLIQENIRRNIALMAFGAASQANVSPQQVESVEIKVPKSLETQKKIAKILSNYDDLIENNNKRIEILEKQAKLIYENFIKNNLNNLIEKNLFDISEVKYGVPLKSKLFTEDGKNKNPLIRIRDLKSGKVKTYTEEERDEIDYVKNKDILIGMDGDFHIAKWSGGKAIQNQRIVRLRPNKNISWYYLFLAIQPKIKHLDEIIVGTTVAHLSNKDLKKINLLIPNNDNLNKINDELDIIYNEEILLKEKNQNLRKTRDLLLPKLISGQIDTKDLNIKIDED